MTAGPEIFHRYDDDYRSQAEWQGLPLLATRVARALGPEPVEDARHLLAPVPLPVQNPPATKQTTHDAPNAATEYVVDVVPSGSLLIPDLRALLDPAARADLDFPRVRVEVTGRDGSPRWIALDEASENARPRKVAVSWSLPDLLSLGEEAARDLRGFTVRLAERLLPLAVTVRAREEASAAARRAETLYDLKRRFGHSIEMRLVPAGRPMLARPVWRALYALGLTWGDMDLFHWHDPQTGKRLFTVSALGSPGYFLPERAAEGGGLTGIALGFELPYSPAPVAVYDRMAVALSYLREHLGGRPVAADGNELDADRLYDDRDALEEAVTAMEEAGIAPGSLEAIRFF